MAHRKLFNSLLLLLALFSLQLTNVEAALCEAVDPFIQNIPEDTPVGTVIRTLRVEGYPDNVTLTGPTNAKFHFDPVSMNITLKSPLDYDNGGSSESFVIKCDVKGSSQTVFIRIVVIIQDVNDNAPTFTKTHYFTSVKETLPVGNTIVTPLTAVDKENHPIYYSLQPGQYSDYFRIERTLLPVLTLMKPLNFESIQNMTITIQAEDQPFKGTKLNASCLLTISVVDEDDMNPVFSEMLYSATVPRNAQPGYLLNMTKRPYAEDPDKTINASIYYSIYYSIPKQDFFVMDNTTAQVMVIKPPASGTYSLIIFATQADNPSRSGVAVLEIVVEGTNQSPPAFPLDSYIVTYPENSPTGSTIVNIVAQDPDFGSKLSYKLLDNTDMFRIDSNSGSISLIGTLDFERKVQYRITATASDGQNTATTTVTVIVADVNDSNPHVRTPSITVNAERRVGESVAVVEAWDEDGNTVLTYALANYDSLFEVNQAGSVMIKADAPLLNKETYDIVVTVSDNGSPPRSTNALVTVNFPAIPVTGATVMVSSVNTNAVIALGVLAGILIIVIIVLFIYIIKKRLRRHEQLDKAKFHHSRDPKGLAFKKQQRIDLSFQGDCEESSDGATTVQENPLSEDGVNNYGYLQSDESETDRDMDEIQIETAVIPYGEEAVYEFSPQAGGMYHHQRSVSDVKVDEPYANSHVFQNGSLKGGSSTESLQSEGTGSKKMLMANGSAGRKQKNHWAGFNLHSLNPDTSVTPIDEKPEITVYF